MIQANAWHRILHLHGKLRRNLYPTASVVAEELEVSSRTIRRDLDILRRDFKAPIAYEASRHGYYYHDATYDLPAAFLSASQVRSLLMARQALGRDAKAPWYESAMEAIDATLRTVPPRKLNQLQRACMYLHYIPANTWEFTSPMIWERLYLCMEGNETCSIGLGGERQLFDPYRVVCKESVLRVAGWDHFSKVFCSIQVNEILELEFTDQYFLPSPDFAL